MNSRASNGIRPKDVRTGVVLSLLMLAILASPYVAAEVAYTNAYDAASLPTASEPAWYVRESAGSTAAIFGASTLEASTLSSESAIQYWAIGTNGETEWGTPEAWNTTTATIDFRVKVIETLAADPEVAQGFWIQVADEAHRFWNFYIGKHAIYYAHQVSGVVTPVDTEPLGVDTSTFNTYRVAISDGLASLYVNDIATPVFDGIRGASSINRTAIIFGDSASFQSSAYVLDYLKWSNVVADFSAPIEKLGGEVPDKILSNARK